MADLPHRSVEDDIVSTKPVDATSNPVPSRDGQGVKFDLQNRPTPKATPDPDRRGSVEASLIMENRDTESDAAVDSNQQSLPPVLQASESGLQEDKGKNKVTLLASSNNSTGSDDAQSKPSSEILAEQHLTLKDSISELNKMESKKKHAILKSAPKKQQRLGAVMRTYLEAETKKKVSATMIEQIKHAISQLGDYEEYYAKAEGPLIALYHDPDNAEALNRIRELNGFIRDENEIANRDERQGCIRAEELVEIYHSAVIHKRAMRDTNMSETERKENYIRFEECKERLAVIVQEEGYPNRWITAEDSSSGTTVSNTTETSSLDITQSNAAEILEIINTTRSNVNVQAEPETISDVMGSGEGDNSSSDTTMPITAEPSSSDPQSNTTESTAGGVHFDERADPRDRQIVYREALVSGYTSKGEEIISHRNIGKNGKQYLIASGHPECTFPLYQLVPGGKLTIWERRAYDIELAKKNRRELKLQWEERESAANKSEFEEALAVARAWSDNPDRTQVTFVWVRLKSGQSMWISRTNFGKLVHSKKTGDMSIIALERELDEKREVWYREKDLSPPKLFIRPRVMEISASRTMGRNSSLEEDDRPDGQELQREAANVEAGNISQLVALQEEINELKGMLRELLERGE